MIRMAKINFDNVKEVFTTAAKESVAEVAAEVESEIISGVMNELIPTLTNRKEALIARLQKEIETTTNWGVKARDLFYIVLVRIIEKIYVKIENVVKA
jgi:hypothetical protein